MRSGLWIWPVWPPAWQLGWPNLWRDRWRWLARRWAFALGGLVVGMLGFVGWQFEAFQALHESEARVLDLQAKLQAHAQAQVQSEHIKPAPGAALNTPTGPPPVMAWWPVQGTQAAVWPQLERAMAQHGLRLLSLRPEPPSHVGAWPSQAVALRLQGRFDEWVNAWAALNARGPVWGLERLRITPQEGGVAIDAVLRLWLSPEATLMTQSTWTPVPADWIPAPVLNGRHLGAVAPVFVATASPSETSSGEAVGLKVLGPLPLSVGTAFRSNAKGLESLDLAPPMPTLSPDPADWPLDQVRLVGVWQQGQGVHLILMAGPHWALARLGQRIGPQGHVVNSIHAGEVHLRAAEGPVWVIGLEKAKP
jgi:hypothetical protein